MLPENEILLKAEKHKSLKMSKISARTIPMKGDRQEPVKLASFDFPPPPKKISTQPMEFKAGQSGVPTATSIEMPGSKPKTAPPKSNPKNAPRITGPVTLIRIKTDDKAFTTEDLNQEEVNKHMVQLPPVADLSDVSRMSSEKLSSLMVSEGKSHNQVTIEMQRAFAIMLFKKDFIVADQHCTITEIEFYTHQDPYLPNDEAFATSAAFYFRLDPHHYEKNSEPAMFLYITAGAPGNRCGILVRSVSTPEGFVEGPNKVYEYIHKISAGTSPRLGLADPLAEAGNSNNGPARIFDSSLIVYNGPRVGLSLRQETVMYGQYCMFVMKPYRYTFCPGDLKVAKHTLAANARLDGIPDMIINRDLKLPAEILGRWITLFGRGESSHLEMFLDGKSKKLVEPSQQLLAHGFLSRFAK